MLHPSCPLTSHADARRRWVMYSWYNVAFWIAEFIDAAILIRWGWLDRKKNNHEDARRLIGLGLCTFVALGTGIAGEVQRFRAQQELQALNEVYQLADDAMLRSFPAFTRLRMISKEDSPQAKRAAQRVRLLENDLAYYEQPLSMVTNVLHETAPDGSASAEQLSTEELFADLRLATIQREERMLIVKALVTTERPAGEVDRFALAVLRNADNEDLHAVAATTSVLRLMHGRASGDFMNVAGWKTFLENHSGP